MAWHRAYALEHRVALSTCVHRTENCKAHCDAPCLQVLLCNPLGLLLYAATTFHFFWDRIPFEVRQSVGRKGTAYALHSTHQLSCTVSEPSLSFTYLPTYSPTYLLTYLSTYLRTSLPTCLRTYLPRSGCCTASSVTSTSGTVPPPGSAYLSWPGPYAARPAERRANLRATPRPERAGGDHSLGRRKSEVLAFSGSVLWCGDTRA